MDWKLLGGREQNPSDFTLYQKPLGRKEAKQSQKTEKWGHGKKERNDNERDLPVATGEVQRVSREEVLRDLSSNRRLRKQVFCPSDPSEDMVLCIQLAWDQELQGREC